jgi:hypothetical protein
VILVEEVFAGSVDGMIRDETWRKETDTFPVMVDGWATKRSVESA